MAITSVLKPAVKAALKKFIKDKSTLADSKRFRNKFNKDGKFTTPQRKFIAQQIGVDDYNLISNKTGREKVPFGEKRKGEDYVTDATRKLIGQRSIESNVKKGYYPKKVSKKTYQMWVDEGAKAFGVPSEFAKQSPKVMGAVQLKRAESALFPGRNTPWEQVFERYGYKPSDFKNIVEGRRAMQDQFKNMDIYSTMDALKILKPGMRTGSLGHTLPISRLSRIADENPNISRDDLMNIVSNPSNMEVQPNFFNQALGGIESLFYNPKYANTPFGMQRAKEALNEAQLTSRILRPQNMEIETYGVGDKPYDYKQLKNYLEELLAEQKYGIRKDRKTGLERIGLLPNISYLAKRFSKGGKMPSYAAGGIGRLGAKLLQKLIGKLSNKELQMILDTSFKGTKPLMSPAKIRQEKLLRKLGPDRYRWRNVKSEVPGPKTSLQRQQERDFFEHTEFWPYKGMGE